MEFCVCVVFTLIARFLLGDFLTFFTFQACIFYNFYFFGFFSEENGHKFVFEMVNTLKFGYFSKWFGLFYLEFCVGCFFWHNWPFFFIRWHFSPFKGQLLKIVTFLRFYFGENGQKMTLVRVNPFIFYIFFSDWSYSIWKSARVFFRHNSPFSEYSAFL